MAKMKFSDLKSGILESLRPELAKHGFSLSAKHGRFVRKHGEISDDFTLVCRDDKPGCKVEPHVAVRIERVEEIYHQTSWFRPEHRKNTCTVGGSVGELSNRPSHRLEFLTTQESGISRVVEGVLKVFQDFALPYFEQYGSLRAIDHELNDDPAKRTRQRALATFRCSTGMIVAKLLARADYDQLASFYLQVMKTDNDGFYLKYFKALLESLKDVEPLTTAEIDSLAVRRLPPLKPKVRDIQGE
jgi:hypothetical protein